MIRKVVAKHKGKILVSVLLVCLLLSATVFLFAQSEDDDIISQGVFISGVDVSGLTYDEANVKVTEYVNTLSGSSLNLHVGENTVTVSVSEIGFNCETDKAVKQAVKLGKSGNIVKRYKEKKDLEANGSVIDLQFVFSDDLIKNVLEQKCKGFDVAAVDAGLKKTSEGFVVTEGHAGHTLDVEASVVAIKDNLSKGWEGTEVNVDLITTVTEPRSAGADLDKVGDLLGTATTSYTKSGQGRCGNVERGAELINGTLLYPGDEFSTYAKAGPITIENGYFMAASYENGQVVESPGGGICQVSTTLYNAVLKSELEVTQRSNHSMIVTYVDPSKDAAIAGTYKDFKFVNNTQYPIYIEGITAGKKITFNIYGVETRDEARSVEYISETVTETAATVQLVATADNFGTITTTQSAHKGVVAQLWKVVYKNGVEESREVVNKSTYNMSPKIISIGTANASPEAMNEINAAIAANDEAAARGIVERYVAVANASGAAVAPEAAEGVVADPAVQPTEQQPTEQQPTEQQPAEQQPAEQQPAQ